MLCFILKKLTFQDGRFQKELNSSLALFKNTYNLFEIFLCNPMQYSHLIHFFKSLNFDSVPRLWLVIFTLENNILWLP